MSSTVTATVVAGLQYRGRDVFISKRNFEVGDAEAKKDAFEFGLQIMAMQEFYVKQHGGMKPGLIVTPPGVPR